MIVLVEVALRDIRAGRRGSPSRCAIALAAERALDAVGVRRAIVLVSETDLATRSRTWIQRPLPEEARAFLRRFDAGAAVSPFTFEIDLPLEGRSVAA